MLTKKRIIFLTFLFGIILILMIPLFVVLATHDDLYFQPLNSSKRAGVESREFGIILGAGLRKNGTPGSYLRQRLNDGIELYELGKIKKILLSGDNSHHAHDEISAMNNYLVENGVPQEVIFGDYAGFDTYSTMERANKIFGIREAVVVTQGFHLPRSVYIAGQKGIDAVGYASSPKYGLKKNIVREYAATMKAVFDCLRNRPAKFYGKKINTIGPSNIVMEQL